MTPAAVAAAGHFIAAFALVAALAMEWAWLHGRVDRIALERLARADALYGLSALAVIGFGLLRVFVLEKPAAYYAHAVPFWLKLALFAAIGLLHAEWLDVGGAVAVGLLSGYMVLQYADVRSSYPTAMTGRAMAVFTMALFLGVALMQWVTGLAASVAAAQGSDPYVAVMLTIAAMLAIGALAFRWLPAPPR